MLSVVPDHAVACGFVNEPVGTHSSRTIMVPELRMAIDAVGPDADFAEVRSAVIEDNVCGKATVSGRREVFRRMAELYSFRRTNAAYGAFRALWQPDAPDAPLLAVLLACARDPLLRATAPALLDVAVGATVTSPQMAEVIEADYPARYSPVVCAGIGRHVAASWTQSGHLRGRTPKVRVHATPGPASATFALYLAALCGARGMGLFDTLWARILDCDAGHLDRLAFAAAQRGWLEYRRIDTVVDIGFSLLDAAAGRIR
jgi:hypothetical protein